MTKHFAFLFIIASSFYSITNTMLHQTPAQQAFAQLPQLEQTYRNRLSTLIANRTQQDYQNFITAGQNYMDQANIVLDPTSTIGLSTKTIRKIHANNKQIQQSARFWQNKIE